MYILIICCLWHIIFTLMIGIKRSADGDSSCWKTMYSSLKKWCYTKYRFDTEEAGGKMRKLRESEFKLSDNICFCTFKFIIRHEMRCKMKRINNHIIVFRREKIFVDSGKDMDSKTVGSSSLC